MMIRTICVVGAVIFLTLLGVAAYAEHKGYLDQITV